MNVQLKDIIVPLDDPSRSHYKLSAKQNEVFKIWDKFLKLLYKNDIQVPKFPIWTDCWDNDIATTNPDFFKKYKRWIEQNKEFYETNKDILDKWLTTSRQSSYWVGAVRKFEWQVPKIHSSLRLKDTLITFRSSGVRVKFPDYTPTLVAMCHIPIYGLEKRHLTPRECLNLQSFSQDFKINTKDKKIYKQIGNAVNVVVIEKSARLLILNEQFLSGDNTYILFLYLLLSDDISLQHMTY